jgi:integrase
MRKLGDLRVHDLRHTAASLMISSGASIKAVQQSLGHSTAALTLDRYSHLYDEDLEALADALDERFAEADAAPRRPKPDAEIIALPVRTSET